MVKNLPANAGNAEDAGSIPEFGRSSGEGNGNSRQYSCLGNPMDRGAWHAGSLGLQEQLSTLTHARIWNIDTKELLTLEFEFLHNLTFSWNAWNLRYMQNYFLDNGVSEKSNIEGEMGRERGNTLAINAK